MNEYSFYSDDRLYGLYITQLEIDKILTFCIYSGNQETGGVLVGFYNTNLDCAIINDVSGPPIDSFSTFNYFYRGIFGLTDWLIKLWKRESQSYYLGEWHFHPLSEPAISCQDKEQMSLISENNSYKCPEPILLIIGGDPRNLWHIKTYAYAQKRGLIELLPPESTK